MAYTKKTWVDDEVIAKDALNNMETGIETANNGIPSNASKSKAGIVKQASNVADVSAEDAGTISEAFNQTEVQKIATLADANKSAINAILASLEAAGIMNTGERTTNMIAETTISNIRFIIKLNFFLLRTL